MTSETEESQGTLSCDQKQEIFDATVRIIVHEEPGKVESALDTMRRGFALKYQVKPNSVRSVSAYVRYRATQALEGFFLEDTIDPDDVVISWDYLTHDVPETRKREAAEDIAQRLSRALPERISGQLVLGLVDDYERRLKKYAEGTAAKKQKRRSETAAEPSATPVTKIEQPNLTGMEPSQSSSVVVPAVVLPETNDRKTGATFNYDNPEKTRWRNEFLMAGVCRAFPPEVRSCKKILCLGGAMNLEPKAYINNGFSPQNILSVEKDISVSSPFHASAEGLGIRTFEGEVKALRSSEHFDVVSLDYPGHVSMEKWDDIESILLSDDAVVVLNMEQKREKMIARGMAIACQEWNRGLDTGNPKDSLVQGMFSTFETLQQRFETLDEQRLSPEEWERQRKILLAQALSLFGRDRKDEFVSGFPHLSTLMTENPVETGKHNNYFMFSMRFAEALAIAYRKKWKVKVPDIFYATVIAMLHYFEIYFTKRPLLSEITYYKYFSEHDGRKSPFQSICARLSRPKSYAQHGNTLRRFASVLEDYLEGGRESRIVVRDVERLGQFQEICCKREGEEGPGVDLSALMEIAAKFRESEGGQHQLLASYGDSMPITDYDDRGREQVNTMQRFWKKVAAKMEKAELKRYKPKYRFW